MVVQFQPLAPTDSIHVDLPRSRLPHMPRDIGQQYTFVPARCDISVDELRLGNLPASSGVGSGRVRPQPLLSPGNSLLRIYLSYDTKTRRPGLAGMEIQKRGFLVSADRKRASVKSWSAITLLSPVTGYPRTSNKRVLCDSQAPSIGVAHMVGILQMGFT